MGARSAGNPHAACDVEGTGNVARSKGLPARQSSTLPTLASKDAVDPLIHRSYLLELANVPTGLDRRDPRVSPLYSGLKGFPPTLIQVGSNETLLEDATRFAAVAGAADVSVTLQIWPHMIHAWHLWNAGLEAGRRALASAGAFMQAHLRPS